MNFHIYRLIENLWNFDGDASEIKFIFNGRILHKSSLETSTLLANLLSRIRPLVNFVK